MSVQLQKDSTGTLRQRIRIGSHLLFADASEASGGDDSAPGPHDIFDSSLAACKAITLMMVARRKSIPLESVDVEIERDASQEGKGHYGLKVKLTLNGNLSNGDRKTLTEVAARCPIHKLMTQTEIAITTEIA
jgi:putative redox protein